ncbi:Dna/Rna non-specific endonuclease [Cardiosporidium cionae]|uniref:Dna/Rna non-specific endonuclease n=1 Tax=Cardiosporidium cionae TaxID=476202 RepID=A0ABQ7J7D7_9APIC|nr:Dna/Rna non-specific endonuclease [Cardiosporidium cionae]|eukprot:KAF8819892.1 Dna/Rna non-specific endonuclease [Cardiosporidium cionae]
MLDRRLYRWLQAGTWVALGGGIGGFTVFLYLQKQLFPRKKWTSFGFPLWDPIPSAPVSPLLPSGQQPQLVCSQQADEGVTPEESDVAISTHCLDSSSLLPHSSFPANLAQISLHPAITLDRSTARTLLLQHNKENGHNFAHLCLKIQEPWEIGGRSSTSTEGCVPVYMALSDASAILQHFPSLHLPSFENLRLRKSYLASINYRYRIPNWVAEKLAYEQLQGEGLRENSHFRSDPSVPQLWRATQCDYHSSGFHRGHLAAAASHRNTQAALDDTFYLSSNIIPQDSRINCGLWRKLEILSRGLTQLYTTVYCISGPLWLPAEDSSIAALASHSVSTASTPVRGRVLTPTYEILREPPSSSTAEIPPFSPPSATLSQSMPTQGGDEEALLSIEKRSSSSIGSSSNSFTLKDSKKQGEIFYTVIGERCVAVPTHLFKIIVAAYPLQNTALPTSSFASDASPSHSQGTSPPKEDSTNAASAMLPFSFMPSTFSLPLPPVLCAAFLIPNISPSPTEGKGGAHGSIIRHQVPLETIEWASGLDFRGFLEFITSVQEDHEGMHAVEYRENKTSLEKPFLPTENIVDTQRLPPSPTTASTSPNQTTSSPTPSTKRLPPSPTTASTSPNQTVSSPTPSLSHSFQRLSTHPKHSVFLETMDLCKNSSFSKGILPKGGHGLCEPSFTSSKGAKIRYFDFWCIAESIRRCQEPEALHTLWIRFEKKGLGNHPLLKHIFLPLSLSSSSLSSSSLSPSSSSLSLSSSSLSPSSPSSPSSSSPSSSSPSSSSPSPSPPLLLPPLLLPPLLLPPPPPPLSLLKRL